MATEDPMSEIEIRDKLRTINSSAETLQKRAVAIIGPLQRMVGNFRYLKLEVAREESKDLPCEIELARLEERLQSMTQELDDLLAKVK